MSILYPEGSVLIYEWTCECGCTNHYRFKYCRECQESIEDSSDLIDLEWFLGNAK